MQFRRTRERCEAVLDEWDVLMATCNTHATRHKKCRTFNDLRRASGYRPLALVSAGHPWGAKRYRLAIILRQMWRSGTGSGSIYGTGLGGNSTALGSKSAAAISSEGGEFCDVRRCSCLFAFSARAASSNAVKPALPSICVPCIHRQHFIGLFASLA